MSKTQQFFLAAQVNQTGESMRKALQMNMLPTTLHFLLTTDWQAAKLAILPLFWAVGGLSRVPKQPDERSPYVQAVEWTSRVMSISLELIAPPLIGYWLDHRMGTLPLFLIVGVALGFVTATMSLVQLSKRPPDGEKR